MYTTHSGSFLIFFVFFFYFLKFAVLFINSLNFTIICVNLSLMGTPYGIQCAIVAVPASVIAILIVSAVTRCNDPKRSLEALYQDN